jgi:SAM-dependent methyltransferase
MSFEGQARSWLSWARTPDHDASWQYRDAFFDELLPPPGRLTLEVGCGEGRVARDLAAHGHTVVALDASPTLAATAAAADPAGSYLVADAAALPFGDSSFDLVVAYNSLMDVDDMPAAVAEAARVLQPGRPLCICVTHPIADAGRFQSTEPDAPFLIAGSYLGRHRVDEPFERNGLQMHFTGWRYPLEAYARALEDASLLIERLREPAAPTTALSTRTGYERWQRLPNFLHVRAIKPATPVGDRQPRLPLFAGDDPTLAERDKQELAGFGE